MKDREGASAMLGTMVLKALGLDPYIWNVTKIVIALGEMPHIELTRMLNPTEGQAIVDAMASHRFVEERT